MARRPGNTRHTARRTDYLNNKENKTNDETNDETSDGAIKASPNERVGSVLRKRSVVAAARRAAPALCHPASAVRASARRFFAAAARFLGRADTSRSCSLGATVPEGRGRHSCLGGVQLADVVADEDGLRAALKPPPSRAAFDAAVATAAGVSTPRERSSSTEASPRRRTDVAARGGRQRPPRSLLGVILNRYGTRRTRPGRKESARSYPTRRRPRRSPRSTVRSDPRRRVGVSKRPGVRRAVHRRRGLTPESAASQLADPAGLGNSAGFSSTPSSTTSTFTYGMYSPNPRLVARGRVEQEGSLNPLEGMLSPFARGRQSAPAGRGSPASLADADAVRRRGRDGARGGAPARRFRRVGGVVRRAVPAAGPARRGASSPAGGTPVCPKSGSLGSAEAEGNGRNGRGGTRHRPRPPRPPRPRDLRSTSPRDATPTPRGSSRTRSRGRWPRGSTSRVARRGRTVPPVRRRRRLRGSSPRSPPRARADAVRRSGVGGSGEGSGAVRGRAAARGRLGDGAGRRELGSGGARPASPAIDGRPRRPRRPPPGTPRSRAVPGERERRPLRVSGGDDGACKLWDCGRLERDVSFRSRLTSRVGAGGSPRWCPWTTTTASWRRRRTTVPCTRGGWSTSNARAEEAGGGFGRGRRRFRSVASNKHAAQRGEVHGSRGGGDGVARRRRRHRHDQDRDERCATPPRAGVSGAGTCVRRRSVSRSMGSVAASSPPSSPSAAPTVTTTVTTATIPGGSSPDERWVPRARRPSLRRSRRGVAASGGSARPVDALAIATDLLARSFPGVTSSRPSCGARRARTRSPRGTSRTGRVSACSR